MSAKKPSAIRRVIALVKDRKKSVIFLFWLVVVSQASNISVPFISRFLIDTLTGFLRNGGVLPWNIIIYSALGILVATLVTSVIQSSYNYHLFKLVTDLEDRASNAAFEKYLQLHALFHHGSSSGQIIGRIERGRNAIYSILNDVIGQNLLPPLVIFIGSFTALLYENVWIALAVLVPFPIYLLVTRKLSNRIYEIEQQANNAFEDVSKEMYDVAGNVLTVKKFSQEIVETEKERILMYKAREIQYGAERLWQVIENTQTAIATTGRMAVFLLSAWFVLNGTVTIGEFVFYITLQNMAYQPLSQLTVIFEIARQATRAGRLFSILDEPNAIKDKLNAIELAPLQKQIEFKNVSFGYHNDKRWALKDINLIFPAGKTIALVGRSGSGKTTFINLLLRSFDPQKGKITIDGNDIRDVTQESLRRQIAVVPQEVDLFSRTIIENIAYGKSDVNKEQVENAAKTALAHDFILKLDKGYKTVVGERGIKLSGGERQRVGIARAVLRDPSILIFDEATSHLDTESERLITKAANALIKNRTSFIIAHRLSTILHADIIIVFKENKVEMTGKHKELLKKSPTYKRLYNLQFNDTD